MAEPNEHVNEANPPAGAAGPSGVADPPAAGAAGAETAPPAAGSEPPAGAEGEGAGAATPSVDPEVARRDRTINEMRKRINALTADKLRLAQAAQAAQPAVGTEPPAPPPQRSGETDAQYQARVMAIAEAIANQREFDRRCNEVAETGKKARPDFLERVKDLVTIHDPHDQQSSARYNAMLDAAIEVGGAAAHDVVYALSGDLEEATRIMNLPPQRMGAALAKLAGTVKPEAPGTSGAPKPITPIPLGGGHENIRASDPANASRLSSDDWHKRRAAEVEAKRAAGRRMA